MNIEAMEYAVMPFTPVPGMWTVGHVRVVNDQGQTMTLLQLIFSSANGVHSVFLDAEKAEKLSDDIRDHARQARTGIVVAGNGSVRDIHKTEQNGQ